MENNQVAIVLGGIVSHIPLITKLQVRGYYVILVDYLDNPSAKKYADRHEQISTFDEEKIYQLARDSKAKLIVNCCLEYLNIIISRISKELGLPCLYSEEIAVAVSNKTQMKKIMIENNIPTARYISVNTLNAAALNDLRYPLFVKPADSSGSNGVNRAENKNELVEYFSIAKEFSKTGEIIIEEESRGIECNAYCYVYEGEAEVVLVSSKYSEIHDGLHKNTKCISTYAPAPITTDAQKEIAGVAQKIAVAFKLYSTPMFLQLMVNESHISIIEFACRIPGGYSYRSILDKLGFDYFDFMLDILEGKKPNLNMRDTGEISLVHSFYASPCVLNRVVGYEELISDGTIVDINIAKEQGSKISDESCNREKVGHFVISAETPKQAIDKVNKFFDTVKVVDSYGSDVLRHDLRLKLECIN